MYAPVFYVKDSRGCGSNTMADVEGSIRIFISPLFRTSYVIVKCFRLIRYHVSINRYSQALCPICGGVCLSIVSYSMVLLEQDVKLFVF